MSIQQGTIAAKIVGINQTKNGLSSVLEQWGEEVPQTFAAYPNAFNNVFENLDEKIDAVSASLSDYLPLSGGTVDKLSVDSPEFYVRNLLSVNVENDKMGGLMLGSNIYNATPPVVDGDKQCAPILIGNDLQSPDGAPMPSIAVGNNSLVRYGGIAIGGATGMSYEYDFGIGSANVEAVHIINPLRRDVVLSTLQFVDENGDAATSALYASDRITIVAPNGFQTIYYVSRTGKWGHNVQKQVGRRIVNVWEDADDSVVLAQQSISYYLHYTPQYLKLKFDPEEINSVDMGAAELFSIAIGNNTMAGAYLSSDGSYQQSPFAGAIAIGAGSIAKDKGTVVIGSNSVAEGNKSIAFGFNAFTSADNAIQFGTGTNDTPRSFQINDVNIVKDNYDSSLSSWTGYKLNPDLLPDGTVLSNDLSAYLPLTGGTISSDTFKWLMSNGSSNMLSVDPVGGNYALGNSSEAGPYLALAIGTNAHATGGAVAIGGLNAWANGDNSIQIGQGTNNTAGTTQIKNWQLLDANGNIPEARLSSVGYAKASSIPTVNNGTLTIQKNGSTVQTFTANQSTAVTANIAVPTKTSELTNDSGFLTAHQDLTDYAKKNDLSNYLPLSGGYETGIISSDFSCVSAHIHFDENDEEGSTNWIEADILMYSPLTAAQNTTRKKYKISINNVTTGGSPEVNIPTNGTYDLEYSPSEQMPSYNSGTWLIDYENDGQSGFTFYIAANDAWEPPYYSNINKLTWTQCSIPSYLATAASIDDYVKANTEDFLNWRNKRRIELGESAMSPTLSANVNNDTGIAIGYSARTYKNASNYTDRSIAIGCNARANTTGTNVYDSGIALGHYAYAGTQGICIGNHQSNYSNGTKSISIGGRQAHTGNNSVQIGWEDTAAYANYTEGVFIGNLVQGRNSSTVIGYGASTTQANNVAVGREAYANGIRSVSLGYQAQGTQADEVCVGYMAKATTSNAMQFGQGTNSTTNTVQFRDKTVLSGDNMTVVKERLPDGIVFVDDLSEALSGYVDLSSNQTVGGDKHFTGKTTFESEYGADGDDHAYPRFQGANPAIEVNGGSDYAQLFTSELDLANSDGSYTSYAKDKIAKYDANFLETAFYLPSVAGNLVVNGQVNTAIGTINTNFTNLKNAINGNNDIAYLTKNTLNSGWSIYDGDNGTANRLRLYHYGKFGYIFGTVKSTSVLNANTTYTIGTLNLPSGYAFMAASMGSGSTDIVWGITAGGSLSVRSFVQRSANTNLGIRIPGLFLSTLPAVVTVNTVGTL